MSLIYSKGVGQKRGMTWTHKSRLYDIYAEVWVHVIEMG